MIVRAWRLLAMTLLAPRVLLLVLPFAAACGSIGSPASQPPWLATLARLEPGSWETTLGSGQRQQRTWHWGPGRHALWALTTGPQGDHSPWGELRVLHPLADRSELGFLVVHSRVARVGRGVGEGTAQVADDGWFARSELWQGPTRPRTTGLRWTFADADTGDEVLSEATGLTGLQPLTEWRFSRIARQPAPVAAKALPVQFAELVPWLAESWRADSEPVRGEPVACRTVFEVLPHVEVLHVATFAGASTAAPLLEAFCYLHPRTDTLRCLVLGHDGAVFTGDARVESGALRCDLRGHEGGRACRRIVHFDCAADGSRRQRVWAEAETGAPLREVRLTAVARDER